MAFGHGKDSRVLMNELHMSTQLNGWQASWKNNLGDSTALSDSGFRGRQGLSEATFSFDGFFDDTATLILKPFVNEVWTNIGVNDGLNATIWPMGSTIGQPAIFSGGDISDFSIEAQVDDMVKVKAELECDAGCDMGVVQHSIAAGESSSTNSTGVDNTVLTSNGGAAMLHVTAISGTTPSLIVKIQHSVDNVTYADLITFTTVTTTIGSEFKATNPGVTVNRYTRAASTIAGTTPNYTYGVSFARR